MRIEFPIAHQHDPAYEPEPETLAETHWQTRAYELIEAGVEPGVEYVFTDPNDAFDLPFPSISGRGYTAVAIPATAIKRYTNTEV